MNKKNIYLVIIFCIILICTIIGIDIYNTNKYEKIGKEAYKKITQYFINIDKYKIEEGNKVFNKIYYFDNMEYYKVLNINDLLSLLDDKYENQFLKENSIIKENKDYYIPNSIFGKLGDYYDYEVRYSKKNNNEVFYQIISTYCLNQEEDEMCDEKVRSESEFSIKKVKNEWLVNLLTFPKLPEEED